MKRRDGRHVSSEVATAHFPITQAERSVGVLLDIIAEKRAPTVDERAELIVVAQRLSLALENARIVRNGGKTP